MISCKIFFQLMISFRRKPKLIATPCILQCSSIKFVSETVFIPETIAENRFGALLEISDKFITKFDVFLCMILQLRLKTVWKISKPYCMTLKTVIVCTTKVRNELSEMGKDMKIKHSVSSPQGLQLSF